MKNNFWQEYPLLSELSLAAQWYKPQIYPQPGGSWQKEGRITFLLC
ncbi:hypothetical protein [Marinilabilia rubra]|nr:hypothetical protein [Marinilabilia rubra]